jgi:transposase-like protein
MHLYRARYSLGDTVEFSSLSTETSPRQSGFSPRLSNRHGRPDLVVINGSPTNREAIVSCDTTHRLEGGYGKNEANLSSSERANISPIGSSRIIERSNAHPADAWVEDDIILWNRTGPHDAQTTGEVCLHPAPTPADRSIDGSSYFRG